MLVLDIAARVKRQFGDESGVQITDADILKWINDAQVEAAMQVPDLYLMYTTLDIVEGNQNVYVLDLLEKPIIDIRSVALKSQTDSVHYPLQYMSNQQLNESMPGWDEWDVLASSGNPAWTGPVGTPVMWTKGELLTEIKLIPVPDYSASNVLKVAIVRRPNDMIMFNDELDVPPYMTGYILEYCLMKAYELDEEWEAADRKAQYVQSTLDFNNHRESWANKDKYPVITTTSEDYY